MLGVWITTSDAIAFLEFGLGGDTNSRVGQNVFDQGCTFGSMEGIEETFMLQFFRRAHAVIEGVLMERTRFSCSGTQQIWITVVCNHVVAVIEITCL